MQFGGISTRLKTCVHRSCLPKVGFHPRHPEGAKTEVLYGTQTSEGSLAPEPRARGTRPGPGVRGLGPGPGAGGPGRGPGPRGPRRPGPRHRPGPKDVGQVPGLIRSRHTPPGLGRRRAVLRLRRVLWRARKPWWQGLTGQRQRERRPSRKHILPSARTRSECPALLGEDAPLRHPQCRTGSR